MSSETPVKEVVLGKSLLVKLGYWLLMRGARAATPSHNRRRTVKKTKVTRSQLRQNKEAEDLVSIEAANGETRFVRVSGGKAKRESRVPSADKRMHNKPSDERTSVTTTSSGRGRASIAERRLKVGKNIPDYRLKKFEQDQFVKTERNIAAAMKEAQKGISAEQLVVRFGLSVPEAGLIASKCKSL